MSRQGSPFSGRNLYIQRTLIDGADFTLVAYTNAQDSLADASVAADLTQPSLANGYTPLLLDGTWSKSNGLGTYVHSAGANTDELGRPCWFPTGVWSAQVTGVALISGVDLVHYYDLRNNVTGLPTTFIAAAGKRLPVDLPTLLA